MLLCKDWTHYKNFCVIVHVVILQEHWKLDNLCFIFTSFYGLFAQNVLNECVIGRLILPSAMFYLSIKLVHNFLVWNSRLWVHNKDAGLYLSVRYGEICCH
jgi:hypothetical protein